MMPIPLTHSSAHTILIGEALWPVSSKAAGILREAGYTVCQRPLEESFPCSIRQDMPDLILLMADSSDFDVYQLCQHLKTDASLPSIPILMLVPQNITDGDLRALHAGADDVVLVPFAAETLLTRIHTHLTLRKCQQQFYDEHQQLEQKIAEHRQAQQALQRRTRELILINQATQAFNSTLDFSTVLQTVLQEMHQLLDIVSTSFWLLDSETGDLECLRATGPNSERLMGWRLHAGQGVTGYVAQHGKPLIVNDTRTDQRHFKGVDEHTGIEIRSLMSLPLYVKDEEVGVLNLADTKANTFSDEDLRLIEPIASAAANAIKNAHLFAELQQAKEHAEQARQEAEAANQAKSLFLANMSHELRTPLNAILGFTYLLAQKTTIVPPERNYVALIKRNGEHLLTLINQVLDLSKIEAHKMTLHETDLDLYAFLDDLVELFRMRAREKALHVVFERDADVPRYVRTDDVKLRQILLNLLSNAIKFTEHGHVGLRVESLGHASESSDNLQFSITDTGPGIAQEELSRLFEAFVQTSTGIHTQQGTGLGLSICREFLHLLGGNIYVQSEPGKGSAFRFYLPVRLIHSASAVSGAPSQKVLGLAPNQPNYNMLVVDDRPEERMLLVKLLEPVGFNVREASSGPEAIESLITWQPDLIWLDIRMPGMSGYDVLKKIENIEPRPVIVAITASSFLQGEEEVMTRQCDAFLRKPYRIDEILELIRQHLGVQFLYEQTVASGASPLTEASPPSAHDLSRLPDVTRDQFRQAVDMVDMEMTRTLIEAVRPQHPGLAQRLECLLKQYRFDILQQLFENLSSQMPEPPQETPQSVEGVRLKASEGTAVERG